MADVRHGVFSKHRFSHRCVHLYIHFKLEFKSGFKLTHVRSPADTNKDGRCVTASSCCTKRKPKHPTYERPPSWFESVRQRSGGGATISDSGLICLFAAIRSVRTSSTRSRVEQFGDDRDADVRGFPSRGAGFRFLSLFYLCICVFVCVGVLTPQRYLEAAVAVRDRTCLKYSSTLHKKKFCSVSFMKSSDAK